MQEYPRNEREANAAITSTAMQRTVATSTGIRIGSAYTPPPQVMSDDSEAIQALLLRKKRMERDVKDDMLMTDALFVSCCTLAGLAGIVMIAWS